MKKFLITIMVAMSFATFAQTDCSIIDSVTIYADTAQIETMQFIENHYGGSATVYYTNTDIIPIDTAWHLVAITINANRDIKLYLDGILLDYFNTNHLHNYSSLYIGARYITSFDHYFNGIVDEFRISNTVRTENEIANSYTNDLSLNNDVNTIELFKFNEASGTTNTIGENGTTATFQQGSPQFVEGKFDNGLLLNGVNDFVNCNMNLPETNVSLEMWVKAYENTYGCIFQTYGTYSGGVYIMTNIDEGFPNYTWSTGDTTSSVTIDPFIDTMVWVSNGICTDTMIFANSYQEVYDTTYVSVTDTLIIYAVLTGITPPNNVNTIKIYPNPAKTHIYINNGDYNLMNGYTVRIDNTLGQTVYTSLIDQQEFYVNLSDWSGNGTYFVYIIDDNSEIIEIKKIIIQ